MKKIGILREWSLAPAISRYGNLIPLSIINQDCTRCKVPFAPRCDHPDIGIETVIAEFEADFERRYVQWLLQRHEGNMSAAARAADMDRKYLYKLAKKHEIDR